MLATKKWFCMVCVHGKMCHVTCYGFEPVYHCPGFFSSPHSASHDGNQAFKTRQLKPHTPCFLSGVYIKPALLLFLKHSAC
jgi:hypothetical protein